MIVCMLDNKAVRVVPLSRSFHADENPLTVSLADKLLDVSQWLMQPDRVFRYIFRHSRRARIFP